MKSSSISLQKNLVGPYKMYDCQLGKEKKGPSALCCGKLTLKNGITFVCILLCLLCFVYQTFQLVSIYLSGKTVVENRVERFKYSQLPAITICLPTFIDMDKFAEFWLKNSNNPKDKEVYENFTRYKDVLNNRFDERAENKKRVLAEYFLKDSFAQNMAKFTLADIFDKISVEIEIRYKFPSLALNETGARNNVPVPIPVYSLVPFEDPRKCLTIFSDFDQNFRGQKLGLLQMEIQFKHNNLSFPYEKYYEEDFYIALHSPNILPPYRRENTFEKLEMGRVNFLSYSEAVTQSLPPPYETNCKTYSLNNSRRQDMRSDCIQKCVVKHLNKKYKNNCLPTLNNDKLVRRENLFDLAHIPFCDWSQDKRKEEMQDYIYDLQNVCEKECPRNCLESFYTYELAQRKGDWYKEQHPNWFSFNIEHSRYPDQIIVHKPIMSWITLVSEFGGQLGMWLGLSVIFVCNQVLNKIFD